MRILFAAGGTAGHIHPALAIAEYVKARDPEAVCLFIGNRNGMEYELVTRKGYPFYPIEMQGFSRSLSPKNIKTLYLTWKAPRAVREIYKKVTPDLVFGTGGFLSYPALKTAKKCGIPTLLHESNAVPGLAVRLSERYTDKLLLNMAAARTGLRHPERAEIVGMPQIAKAFPPREEARRRLGIPQNAFFLLSFGGSLGAAALNRAAAAVATDPERQADPSFFFVHATGKRYFDEFLAALPQSLPPRFRFFPFLYEIPLMLAAADVAMTRAGAATLAELTESRTPAILIPSPNVTQNHQYRNALAFTEAGAGWLLTEDELTEERIRRLLCKIIASPMERRKMQKRAEEHPNAEALPAIYREICRLTQKNV